MKARRLHLYEGKASHRKINIISFNLILICNIWLPSLNYFPWYFCLTLFCCVSTLVVGSLLVNNRLLVLCYGYKCKCILINIFSQSSICFIYDHNMPLLKLSFKTVKHTEHYELRWKCYVICLKSIIY